MTKNSNYPIVSTPAPDGSALAGHRILAYDWDAARAYVMHQKARGVRYELGCKVNTQVSNLADPDPHFVDEQGQSVLRVDCSGIQRGMMAVATPSHVHLPDGSWEQDAWCAAQGLKVSAMDPSGYLDVCANTDGHTRMCFIHPNENESIGHVFLVRNRVTLESHGGCGPDSRPFDTHVLAVNTCKVYVLC